MIPSPFGKFLKNSELVAKKCDGNDCLQIKAGDSVISNDFDLAENFNVAPNLKEPLEQSPFNELKEHVNAKIPENVHFELPELDENFVFKFLSTLDISKATGLDGTGPKLLKISSGIITKSITYIVNT